MANWTPTAARPKPGAWHRGVGLVLAILWTLSLALVFLSPLALPSGKGASWFATTSVDAAARIDWVDPYIPSNPFHSLANAVVLAVVVFSILMGIAILRLPGKQRVVGPISLVNDALGEAGGLLVKLTPLGLFAIAGHSAATLPRPRVWGSWEAMARGASRSEASTWSRGRSTSPGRSRKRHVR